jgi:3-methyl-2-oxobutanoate hydroxymethyltransferase
VLVYHDTLKYGSHHLPKFVRSYAETGEIMKNGISAYVEEVKSGAFPAKEHRFAMKEDELQQLYGGK